MVTMVKGAVIAHPEAGDTILDVEASAGLQNVAANTTLSEVITVANAEVGDFAAASFSADIGALILTAVCNTAGQVRVNFSNLTGGDINRPVGTTYVRVTKR